MTGPIMLDAPAGGAGQGDDFGRLTALGVVLVALSAVSGLLFGYDTGVVSGSMLLVRHAMKLTDDWHELIVSGTVGAAWLFCLIGGYLTDQWGRRRTILAASVAFTAGALVMGLADGKETLLVGRVIAGVGVGLASMSTPVYIAECTTPRARGAFVMLYTLGCTSGQFVAGIVAGLFSNAHDGWRWMLGLAALPSLVLLVGFLFLPESPRWLVARGRADEAEAVLQLLRGAEADVGAELKGIEQVCEEERRKRDELAGEGRSGVLLRVLRTRHARRALLLGCALQAYQQLSGINTAMYYTATIIRMAGVGDNSTAIWLSAAVAGVNCACTLVGILLVDRLGRRPLALVSLFTSALALVVLGSGFLLMDRSSPPITDVEHTDPCAALLTCSDCTSAHHMCGFCLLHNGSASCWPRDDVLGSPLGGACAAGPAGPAGGGGPEAEWAVGYCPSDYSWIAVAGLVLYLFCFAPGMGPVPWVINSEIHPLWARDLSSSIATSCTWSFNLLVSLTFLTLVDLISAAGTFYMFSGISFSGVVLLWFIMPETKGTSLEEIEIIFGAKESPDSSPVKTNKSASTIYD